MGSRKQLHSLGISHPAKQFRGTRAAENKKTWKATLACGLCQPVAGFFSVTSTDRVLRLVTKSRLVLLAARQASKSRDEVLEQGIRLYLESQQTAMMLD